MGNYFVVLQLSQSGNRRLGNGNERPLDFGAFIAGEIKNKKVKLLFSRCDTGVAEDLRLHARQAKQFTTYLLVIVPLEGDELFDKEIILNKAACLAGNALGSQVVDTNDKFELIVAA